MSSIKLKHSGGNAVAISAPDTNPSSDRTVKLPSTDADGVITTKDSDDSLQAVTGVSGSAFTNRNLLINGAFNFWQRNTSVSGGSALDNFIYTADRFWLYSPSSSSGTVGQTTDVPSGFLYAMHNNLDTNCTIGTNVELRKKGSDYPFVNGESVTLSFYIKSTSARSGVSISISTRDNAGGTNSVTRASGVTFNSTTSWTRVEKTFSLSGTVGGNNAIFQFEFVMAVGDKVTGFQLEKGTVATNFEHLPMVVELAKCQRYFTLINADGGINNYAPIGIGRFYNSTNAQILIALPTTMRTSPTIEALATSDASAFSMNQGGGFNAQPLNSIALNESSFNAITVQVTSGSISGQTTGMATTMYSDNTDNAKLGITAEF